MRTPRAVFKNTIRILKESKIKTRISTTSCGIVQALRFISKQRIVFNFVNQLIACRTYPTVSERSFRTVKIQARNASARSYQRLFLKVQTIVIRSLPKKVVTVGSLSRKPRDMVSIRRFKIFHIPPPSIIPIDTSHFTLWVSEHIRLPCTFESKFGTDKIRFEIII